MCDGTGIPVKALAPMAGPLCAHDHLPCDPGNDTPSHDDEPSGRTPTLLIPHFSQQVFLTSPATAGRHSTALARKWAGYSPLPQVPNHPTSPSCVDCINLFKNATGSTEEEADGIGE